MSCMISSRLRPTSSAIRCHGRVGCTSRIGAIGGTLGQDTTRPCSPGMHTGRASAPISSIRASCGKSSILPTPLRVSIANFARYQIQIRLPHRWQPVENDVSGDDGYHEEIDEPSAWLEVDPLPAWGVLCRPTSRVTGNSKIQPFCQGVMNGRFASAHDRPAGFCYRDRKAETC